VFEYIRVERNLIVILLSICLVWLTVA